MNHVINSIEDWKGLAATLAESLKPGDIVALKGDLGVGKTTFTQVLAKELGSASSPKSPTFSLMRTYTLKQKAIKRLIHVDAYRIESDEDMRVLDLDEELAEGDAILVLEWPERVAHWLEKRPYIELSFTQEGEKRCVELRHISSLGPSFK